MWIWSSAINPGKAGKQWSSDKVFASSYALRDNAIINLRIFSTFLKDKTEAGDYNTFMYIISYYFLDINKDKQTNNQPNTQIS